MPANPDWATLFVFRTSSVSLLKGRTPHPRRRRVSRTASLRRSYRHFRLTAGETATGIETAWISTTSLTGGNAMKFVRTPCRLVQLRTYRGALHFVYGM